MTRWKRYLIAEPENRETLLRDYEWMFYISTIIEEALDGLIDTECPHCHTLTQVPTFEEIQEWLEKEENGS